MPEVKISGYTDEQCKTIQEQHKELLRYARDNNDSGEVAFVFREGLTDRKIVVGNDAEINLGQSTVGNGFNQFVMHNHPRGSSFSLLDVTEFLGNRGIKTISIVKNNGNVELLTKLGNIDPKESGLILSRLLKKHDTDKAIEKFLKKEEGIEWVKKTKGLS